MCYVFLNNIPLFLRDGLDVSCFLRWLVDCLGFFYQCVLSFLVEEIGADALKIASLLNSNHTKGAGPMIA